MYIYILRNDKSSVGASLCYNDNKDDPILLFY